MIHQVEPPSLDVKQSTFNGAQQSNRFTRFLMLCGEESLVGIGLHDFLHSLNKVLQETSDVPATIREYS